MAIVHKVAKSQTQLSDFALTHKVLPFCHVCAAWWVQPFVTNLQYLFQLPPVQWLRLHASSAENACSIPGQGTKIPQAVWCSHKIQDWASLVAQMVKNLPAMQEAQV